MSKFSPVFDLALGALWTAGYKPAVDERKALLARTRNSTAIYPQDVFAKAISELEVLGYPIAASPHGYRLLDKHADIVPMSGPPSPGHAVIITGSSTFDETDRCFLQGQIGQIRRAYSIAARGSFFCDRRKNENLYFDLTNGGPSTIGYVDTNNFVATADRDTVFAWDFAFTQDANTAINFMIETIVWRYAWNNNDEIFDPEDSMPSRWLAA